KSVRPGDSWQTRFQNGKIDLEKLYSQTNVTSSFGPARGEFVGVEWEMGHPCAKIKNTISEGQMTKKDQELLKKNANFAGDKLKLDETVWFALDTRQVLKIVRDTTLETKVENAGGMGGSGMGGPGAPGGRGPGGPGGAGRPGSPAGRGGPGGRGGADSTGLPLPPTGIMQGPPGYPGGSSSGGYPGQGRPGGYPGQGGGYPGQGGRGGVPGGGEMESQYMRIRIQRIFVLEQ
ncbi:MAG: hypothetical protein EOP84_32455, partial [Verrucomicrobiaceae bacterium]